jgi:hypothetical protein
MGFTEIAYTVCELLGVNYEGEGLSKRILKD